MDIDGIVTSEYASILESFRKCLELRDKYMRVSGQMLGFNPKDHDEHFTGLDDRVVDVAGVRPDVDLTSEEPSSPFTPWKIYPRPPPPHWHWAEKGAVHHTPSELEDEEFVFENCQIPGPDANGWDFDVDERGVYQVYDSTPGEYISSIIYNIFSILFRCQRKTRSQSSISLLSESTMLTSNTFWVSLQTVPQKALRSAG